jgi:hypothetical protein
MKELLHTTDLTVIALAQMLLRNEDITCFEFDVYSSILEGSIDILPRRLMVADRDHFVAAAIMRDNDIDLGQ